MYFTADSLFPENQEKLIITAAPYGPQWLPADYSEDIPVTFEEQAQKALDCYNAGATCLHIHVRDPKTGHGSTKMSEFSEMISRLRDVVPKMILQVGGSISFAPEGDSDKGRWLGYDTRHMLAELQPQPDQVTIAINSCQMNITELLTADDVRGTHLDDPAKQAGYADMVADASPSFYIEHLKRLRANKVSVYFMLGYIHQLETVEHLIRNGAYMGPLNHALVAIGGGGCGRNPADILEYIRRSPQGSIVQIESAMRSVLPLTTMATALGAHIRVGIEDTIWDRKGHRATTVSQIERAVRIARELGREIATGDDARTILKIGTWYDSVEETLQNLGLPPNRKDGQLGFLVRNTDGTRKPPLYGEHPIAGQSAAATSQGIAR